ncbi:MAG TPA: YitT family protein [Limnochordia bacterium]|nr:YitT family protein [Limnochordia bacterium]
MVRRIVLGYGGVLLGVVITALGVSFFLIPAKIAAGGVSGLATVVYHLTGFPAGVTMLLLNVPLFILSWRVLGSMFGARTLFGTVALSLFVDLFSRWAASPMTEDLVLAAIYGGVLSGVGLGIAFRCGGSTGGTDMAAQLLARFFPTSVGQALLFVDGAVILLAGAVFGLELAMYALIAVFISTKAIDLVQEGQNYAKACLIISDFPEEISQAIMHQLERGVTSLHGQGMYTRQGKDVLLVIVSRMEIAAIKRIVATVDRRAFVIIHDVHEVLGEGFRRLPESPGVQ